MWKDHLLSSCHEHFGTTSTRGKGRFRCLLLRAADETQLIAVLKCQLPQSLQVAVEALLARDAQLSTLPSLRRVYYSSYQSEGEFGRRPILGIVITSLRHYSEFPSLRAPMARYRAPKCYLGGAARLLVEAIGARRLKYSAS